MAQNNKSAGISKTLRTLTDAEKISFYKSRGHKAADMTHVEANGQTRSWTEEEFEDHILEHMPHPDIYEQDLSYIGKRREEYPDEVEQLDALWKMVAVTITNYFSKLKTEANSRKCMYFECCCQAQGRFHV